MPGDTSRSVRGWPGVIHSTLGLLLAGFAFFHAAQNYPAVGAAGAWVERALEHSLGGALSLVIVLGTLGLHAALGLRSYLRQRRSGLPSDAGLTFQLFTGALIGGFVAYHVIALWPSGGASSSVREPYARLWHRLGEPMILSVYVVGISALAFHFGHGLLRLLGRGSFSGARPLGRALGGVLGFVLLFVFVQIVAHFALGEALVPALS
jgi:succinate dehydrogenase/fumarate reductase cytochrome b subunit